MIERMKKDKLKTATMIGAIIVFVVGIVITALNTGDTYALTCEFQTESSCELQYGVGNCSKNSTTGCWEEIVEDPLCIFSYYDSDGTFLSNFRVNIGSTFTDNIIRYKDGYIFLGYSDTLGSSEVKYKIGESFVIDESMCLHSFYAVWEESSTYTIIYDANEGTGGPSNDVGTIGVKEKISETEPTLDGFEFKFWEIVTGGNGVNVSPGGTYNLDNYVSNGSVTLKAVWESDTESITPDTSSSSTKYTKDVSLVSCYVNASTSSDVDRKFNGCTAIKINPTNSSDWSYSTTYGCYIQSNKLSSSKPSSCSSDDNDNTEEDNSTPDTYKISYDANGGTGAPSSQNKTEGTDLTLSNTKPTRKGYTFVNWNTSKDGKGTSYNAGAKYTADAKVTLYAQWKANEYKVTYHGNGGLYNGSETWVDTNKAVYGKSYKTWSNDNFFVRDGYTFIGWNEKADGSSTADWTSYINKDWTWTYTSDVTLYAQWEKTVDSDDSNNESDDENDSDKIDDDIKDPDKIGTGDALIYTVYVVGLGALGYSVYYFIKRRNSL